MIFLITLHHIDTIKCLARLKETVVILFVSLPCPLGLGEPNCVFLKITIKEVRDNFDSMQIFSYEFTGHNKKTILYRRPRNEENQ